MTPIIARTWRCRCPKPHRDGFLKHLGQTGVDECKALPGYLGCQVLERELNDVEIEISLVTYWRSLKDVKAFAGQNIGEARLYPGDEIYRIVPETFVRHDILLFEELLRA